MVLPICKSVCKLGNQKEENEFLQLFDNKNLRNRLISEIFGRSVIIGFQKTQIYQRFAGSWQEVFILIYGQPYFHKYVCCKLAVEFYSRMGYTMFERS